MARVCDRVRLGSVDPEIIPIIDLDSKPICLCYLLEKRSLDWSVVQDELAGGLW